MEGVAIITHDDAVSNTKQRLGYPLVFGICEAKGLEFESVIVLDFFIWFPSAVQKPFRELLLDRNTIDASIDCPELEGYLKLLYTGVTRCIQRLLFVETSKSPSGDAFFRWITAIDNDLGQLAVRQTVHDVGALSRTPDEWRLMGMENATNAETSSDADESLGWTEKAIYCLDRAGDTDLARKARTHRASLLVRCAIEKYRGGIRRSDLLSLELESARTVEGLISEYLLEEARKVVEAMIPLVTEYTGSKLRNELLAQLPLLDEGQL